MKYLKSFSTHAQYEEYIDGEDKVLPNVSLCINDNEVHYNRFTPETKIVATFNVTSTSSATNIMASDVASYFSEIEIDGVAQQSVVTSYTFPTTGEHTVKYTLVDQTNIPNVLFGGCANLTNIYLPNTITNIANAVFGGCVSLTSVTIPSSVTSIANEVFSGCTSLSSIKVSSDNTVYDSRDNCNAIIETATNTLIYGCKNTVIPNTVTSIGYAAFMGCSGLTSIDIPSSVTSIGDEGFGGCTGLTSINIPDSVTSIGSGAFETCSNLSSVTVNATTPPTLDMYAFLDNASGRKIYVPSASVNTYKTANNWSTYASDIMAISSAHQGGTGGN